VIGALILALSLAAPAARAAPNPDAAGPPLRVFAAASLADAFGEIAKLYETRHPGARVQLNLAGSQQLAQQIEQGAAADVFAAADSRTPDALVEHQRLAGPPVAFARNALVVIVPASNPGRLAALADLAKPGVKLVLGADAVPVGHYSRALLARLERVPSCGPGFAKRVLANLVSEEENVKSVVGKVQLGEADAGIAYRSDVTPAVARYVRTLPLPDSLNVIATYPIAVVAAAPRRPDAEAFVALVRSAEGQHVLARHGFLPVATP
jgi:molybdate transport system substrate-binding protein